MAMDRITLIGLILTLVALIFSWWQLWLSRKQSSAIRDIAQAVSTQYVGTFPDNMTHIIQLIESAKRSLIIVTDVPSYGHYSNPLGNEHYRSALKRFLSPIDSKVCRVLTYSEAHRRRFAKEQLPVKSIDNLLSDPRWLHYKRFRPKEQSPTTVEEFYILLAKEHTRFIEEFKLTGAEFLENGIDEQHRVFMWIADDERAIFSFYNFGPNSREVSFSTNDAQIIKVLQEIAESAIAQGRKVPD